MSTSLMKSLEKWEQSVHRLAKKHWRSEDAVQSISSFGHPPDHDPQMEKVRRHEIHGETAVVETQLAQSSPPTFYEYRLNLINGEWRITSMGRFFDDENEQPFSEAAMRSLFEKTSLSPDLPPHEKGDEPNCEVLFEASRVVKGTLMQKPEAIRILRPGKLSLPSGMIIAQDFGYSPEDARPLSQKVQPGDYDIEACILEGRIAAIRILFSNSKALPFSYRQAMLVEGGSSSIGVDAGNVAICDAEAFMKRNKRNHERDYASWVEKITKRPPNTEDVTLLQLHGSNCLSAVVSGSGHGDGCYPSYWVFDAQNQLVAFTVDFQIAAEQLYRTIKIPWKPGISGIVYRESGLVVDVQRDANVVLSGENVSEVRWLDATGALVANSHQFASSHSGDKCAYRVDFDKLDGKATSMEVQIYTGFRNNR